MKVAIILSLLIAPALAANVALTSDNFAATTSGKAVFIKFFAPWCGHCKAMADDWEKLATEWENSEFAVIAEVDCTVEESQEICQQLGVEGFPTIKFGDPDDLQDYNGGREYEELAVFATAHLKPICSPTTVENCDDDMKQKIAHLQLITVEELLTLTAAVEEKMVAAEEKLEVEIETLQTTYENLMINFDSTMKGLKDESGYALMKAVLGTKEIETVETDEQTSNDEL